jgi:hypothetical protein
VFEGLFYVAKVTTCLLLDLMRHPWPRRVLEHPTAAATPCKQESAARPAAEPAVPVPAGQPAKA